MKDLVRPKLFGGPTVSLIYHGSLLKQQCLMKLFFMQTVFLPKSFCFLFFSDCGVSLLDMYACRRVVANIRLPVFEEENSFIL